MPHDLVLSNAIIVAPERAFLGSVRVERGVIAEVREGGAVHPGEIDCERDHLLPGLVELHTDNLERHLSPRPGVRWPRRAAFAAHDGEFALAGATTVLDALRVGALDDEALEDYAVDALTALRELTVLGRLRAEHHVHIRCELTAPSLIEEYDRVGGDGLVRLVSLMDHTPGQRQFARIEKYVQYHQSARGYSESEMEVFIERARALQREHGGANLAALADRIARAGLRVASHDDATREHVAESRAMGATVAEFPTTLEAARASREAGMRIIMGAPNLLRGGSHSGNVSALDLAREGLLDILSSDYAPASLPLAAFKLAEEVEGWTLPRAVACVTRNPAEAVGLTDRGAIAAGLRGDLARVYHSGGLCVTRGLWREGARVL